MNKSIVAVLVMAPFAWACGGSFPPPTQRLADAQSAERSAIELGANNEPGAQLSLRLAQEQIAQFASAKWDLLPAAQLKLNDVANALTKEDPTSKMVVEGHTDSQGAPAYNQDLSQHRAQAVRDYLVTRGIAADRITAQGFGSGRSIADNNSPEEIGRAHV